MTSSNMLAKRETRFRSLGPLRVNRLPNVWAQAFVTALMNDIFVVLFHDMGDQLTVVRTIPWFKANLNYTGQALIISAGINGFFFCIPCSFAGKMNVTFHD